MARQVEALAAGRGALGSVLARRADADDDVYRLQDIAVMYRTNAQSRAIEEAFLRYGLRYQLVGGTRFYQRREVKDALAYLRLLRNDHDVAAFERIVNVPARGLGQRSLEVLRELTAQRDGDVWAALAAAAEGSGDLTARARQAFGGFRALIERLRRRVGLVPLPELLDVTLEDTGYRAMLMDGSQDGEDRWANLLELREVFDRYGDLEPGDALDRLLEETALVADQDAYAGDADKVTLITLHAAKGLEFEVVFICGLEEGVFPHARSLEDPRQMEEERRLAYVGLTRARKRLYLTHAAQRATWGRSGFSVPSRFLLEIPEGLMHGPRLVSRDDDDDQRPIDERLGGYDLSAVIGRRASETRLVGRRPIGPGAGRRLPPGGGYSPPPSAPRRTRRRARRVPARPSDPRATWPRDARPTTAGPADRARWRLGRSHRRPMPGACRRRQPCRASGATATARRCATRSSGRARSSPRSSRGMTRKSRWPSQARASRSSWRAWPAWRCRSSGTGWPDRASRAVRLSPRIGAPASVLPTPPQGEPMTEAEPLLDCRDLRKRYKSVTAVDGVSFHIGRGETYGLLGPNGAGKTTSISMVCGLLERDGGTVTVAGRPMDIDATEAKSLIGYVPQDLAIYPDLSARENLRFFGRLQHLGGAALDARVAAILELTGLTERANDRTETYSGGMKRRLNIGIGLLHEPQLLVLDEPTVGVDPQSRNAILEAVDDLRAGGMSILYTTHYMEEAERLCDRIGIIDAGRILAEGTRRELVAMVGQLDHVRLTASGSLAAAATAIAALERVETASLGDGAIEVTAHGARTLLPGIITAATDAGAIVNGVEVVEADLEAVFLHLTGRALRD